MQLGPWADLGNARFVLVTCRTLKASSARL